MSTQPLPATPSLDHLKKQAKTLLAAHRAGESDAIARINAHHPRWTQASDAQSQAMPLSLSVAQLVIAREYGFPSWPKLKHAVETALTRANPAATPSLNTYLDDIPLFRRGKVRDVYDLGDLLLIIATDRISAYDCIMPNGIPGKGALLTAMSLFWFDLVRDIVPNHLVTADVEAYPPRLQRYAAMLRGRSMLVKKAERFDAECVVRGYLAGSGWREYRQTGAVCGITLPAGLQESARLEAPLFTPATKADSGHDENIPFDRMADIVGRANAERLRELSLAVYVRVRDYADTRGIIIADTKFEFGVIDGHIALIDEILSPDSSRFWPKDRYQPGRSQDSFDKQVVRDYLDTLDWDKTPPAPALPEEIVTRTREKYEEAHRLCGGL